MICLKCGEEVVESGQEPQYDSKGTYIYCPLCQAKNYTETDSDDGGSHHST